MNDGQPDVATVVVTLPGPEIIHNELDTAHSRIVAQQTPQWQPNCERHIAEMTLEAQQKIQAHVEQVAREQGILQRAQEQAAFTIERILINAGYRNVTIRHASEA